MFRSVRVPVMDPRVSCDSNGILGDPKEAAQSPRTHVPQDSHLRTAC